MRKCMMLLVFVFTLGVMTMSPATTIADDPKKEEKKFDESRKETYSEKATVKQWSGKKFLNPVENVPAHKREIKGKLVIYTIPSADNDDSTIGTEIVLADGTYVVTKVTKGNNYRINYVTKKEQPKP